MKREKWRRPNRIWWSGSSAPMTRCATCTSTASSNTSDDARLAQGPAHRRGAGRSPVLGTRWPRTSTTRAWWGAIAEVARERGVLLVDRFEAMRELARQNGDRFYLAPDNLHLNDTGHRCTAEQLARSIVAGLLAPPPTRRPLSRCSIRECYRRPGSRAPAGARLSGTWGRRLSLRGPGSILLACGSHRPRRSVAGMTGERFPC